MEPTPMPWRFLLQLAVAGGLGFLIGVPTGVWLGWRNPPAWKGDRR